MRNCISFYIDGQWVKPLADTPAMDIVNPADGLKSGHLALGSSEDVDRAVQAARKAFPAYSQTSRQDRMDLLASIIAAYEARKTDMAEAITLEMGAPKSIALESHAAYGLEHLTTALKVLQSYSFEERRGSTLLVHEPIGVCGLITPWNWPIYQITAKVAPALATGCTIVLKPSELSPYSATLFAEICHSAGVPAGVFNLVHGDGQGAGTAIASHPDIDMVSFTGSTRGGIAVAQAAAATVKRVTQELGGKSPAILLDDADVQTLVSEGVYRVMRNSGQTCSAPTRLIVSRSRMEEAKAVAKEAVLRMRVGPPDTDPDLGPVVSDAQWGRIQGYIKKGIEEGATLVAGGPGKPENLEAGCYVRPTVFADVHNDMAIAQEEIFGPVLVIIGHDGDDHAVEIANDTPYGLAAYVYSSSTERARVVARQIRAGQVEVNGGAYDPLAPFGGYKQSGNGREVGDFAFAEYLEVKALLGFHRPEVP